MNILTAGQIQAGAADLTTDMKLKATHVEDLVSIFRGYLGELADDYTIAETLTAAQDVTDVSQKCAKLVACLALFQDSEVGGNGGFAPTVANRSGFNYSIDNDKFYVFKYAFGLFWTIPSALENQYLKQGARRTSQNGKFTYVAPPRNLIG